MVSLGNASGGWQRTRISGVHFSASMVSFMPSVTPVVHSLYPVGLGLPALDDRLRKGRWYCAPDPVFGSGPPPRRGRPHEECHGSTVTAKPFSEAGDTLAGRCPVLQGPLPFNPVVRSV